MSCKVDGMSGASGGLVSLGSITQYTPNSLFALSKNGGGDYDYFIGMTDRSNYSTSAMFMHLLVVLTEPTIYLGAISKDNSNTTSVIAQDSQGHHVVNTYYILYKTSSYGYSPSDVTLYGVKLS